MKTPNGNRQSSKFAEPAIQYALAGLGLILLGWPLIQIAGDRGAIAMFIYVFLAWAALAVLLFTVSRSLRRALQPAEDSDSSTAERR